MKNKLTGGLTIALTFTMLGYMSLSLRSANAQGAGKIATPAKSMPVKSASEQSMAPTGAGKVLAPVGAGVVAPVPQAVVAPVVAEEVVAEAKKGGCCGRNLDNNPCLQAMVDKPCKDLMIAERLVCQKQEMAKCIAKKKEMMKETNPCLAGMVNRPCKGIADEMARAVCVDKEIAKCKAKWSGTSGK
jgi:hypothetical protein